MKRRTLTVILTMTLLLTFMMTSAFADGSTDSDARTETIDNIEYLLNNDNTASVLKYKGPESTTSITIPSDVRLPDGTLYKITSIYEQAFVELINCKSVYVPETITSIGKMALGYYGLRYDGNVVFCASVVDGFTIYGKIGSAAEQYAKASGIKFRDLEAEKKWNGTLSTAVPKVKGIKFKNAKKKITVEWKKQSGKNFKKYTKVEIQICKDKKFDMTNTKRIEVKKTKRYATIKKLKKGTYYVRIRNVKFVGADKLVSKWSKVKKVRVK